MVEIDYIMHSVMGTVVKCQLIFESPVAHGPQVGAMLHCTMLGDSYLSALKRHIITCNFNSIVDGIRTVGIHADI